MWIYSTTIKPLETKQRMYGFVFHQRANVKTIWNLAPDFPKTVLANLTFNLLNLFAGIRVDYCGFNS
jgi:hypothetical protein